MSAIVRWITGLTLIVAALVSLFTAMGKLDNALSDNVKDDLKQGLYSTGLITFKSYSTLPGAPKTLDAGNSGVRDFAELSIPDSYLFRNVRREEIDGRCNYHFESPECRARPDQHTTYCRIWAVLQSCTPGNSRVVWRVVADVIDRYDTVKPTALGIAAFCIAVVTGLWLIIRRQS